MLMCVLNLVQVSLAVLLIYLIYGYVFCFEQRKSKIPFIVLSALTVTMATALPLLLENAEDADELKETLLLVISMVYSCTVFRHNKKLLVPVLGLLINSSLDYIVFMVTSTFGISSFYTTGIIYCVIYALIIVIALIFKNRIKKETMQNFFDNISPAFYVVILIADISAYYDVVLSSDSSYYVEVSNIIRLFSTVLMVCGVFYIVSKYTTSLHLQKESELQVEMQLKLYNEMMQKNKDIREFRHDYKNNLFSIGAFIENEKYLEAKKYIEDLNIRLESAKNRYATGNYLADAIISDKADNASEFNVDIDFNGTIPEHGISNLDLCTVLANSLDNAIRACAEIAPCKIRIDSKESSKGVIITIKNPVSKKVEIKDNKIKTTKSDKVNHGIGLNNIKKVAEKYNGFVELRCDDRFFEIETGLYFI